MELKSLLKAMRPRQWPKNVLFIYAPLVFDGKLDEPLSVARVTVTTVLFILMSSAIYLLNDLADVESDRQHPDKQNRPIASGKLPEGVAWAAAFLFATFALAGGFLLTWQLGVILLLYLGKQIAYSYWLKRVVLLDVFVIAIGFVLRVGAGVAVIEVERFSPWLYVCAGLLALFLGFGKRRQELVLLGSTAESHRSILAEYSIELLDRIIGIVTTSLLVAYSLYTFLAEGLPENHLMMLTIPFVMYGIFRYLYLIHIKGEGGAPEDIFFKDRPLQVDMALWGVMVMVSLYIA
ncbi:MAG: decaprenyl-phosphate phosphoribosyltransferase [Anaerolineae bacterium]|nr:decaprenyl-phosphate phosphoribosyltransferase [Anaerolineae bacterium]